MCMSSTNTSEAEMILAYAQLSSETSTSSAVHSYIGDSPIVPSMHRAHSGRPYSALPTSSSFHRGLDSGLYKVPTAIDENFDVSPYTKNLTETTTKKPSKTAPPVQDHAGITANVEEVNQCTKPTMLDDVCIVAHGTENASTIYMPFPVETGDMMRCWKEQQEKEDEQEQLIRELLEKEQQIREDQQRKEDEEREEREAREREAAEQEDAVTLDSLVLDDAGYPAPQSAQMVALPTAQLTPTLPPSPPPSLRTAASPSAQPTAPPSAPSSARQSLEAPLHPLENVSSLFNTLCFPYR